MVRKVSFKAGTKAARARSRVAESIKRSGKVKNPFAVATAAVKKMSPSRRAKVAKKR